MSNSTDDLPFSQRYGYAPVVQQLALGEITTAFREEIKALLDQVIIEDNRGYILISSVDTFRNIFLNICGGSYPNFSKHKQPKPISFEYKPRLTIDYSKRSITRNFVINFLSDFVNACDFFRLFDLLEELINNQEKLKLYTNGYDNSGQLFGDALKELFKKHHLAYTIYDRKIVPISNETEGKTYVAALDETRDTGQLGAHSHLLKAGEQINHQKWADSVRESISAVEAVSQTQDSRTSASGNIRLGTSVFANTGSANSGFETTDFAERSIAPRPPSLRRTKRENNDLPF